MISLDEQIKKDKDQFHRNRRNQRKDHQHRKRYEDYPNRRNYQSKRNYDERQTHNQQMKQTVKISNLHYGITKQQLQTILSQFGKLKTCRIDWDKMGRSKQTATIEYFQKEDEERAVRELNGKELQGQPIKVELVSQTIAYPSKRHEISKQYNNYRGNKHYRK